MGQTVQPNDLLEDDLTYTTFLKDDLTLSTFLKDDLTLTVIRY